MRLRHKNPRAVLDLRQLRVKPVVAHVDRLAVELALVPIGAKNLAGHVDRDAKKGSALNGRILFD